MAKRYKAPRPAASETPSIRRRGPRDPLSRLLLFCELLALGMVAASIYLRYPKELLKGDLPEITLDQFPTFLQKAAFIAVHTRAPWVVLALIGLVTAVIAFQSRNKPKRNRLVAIAPVAVLIVMRRFAMDHLAATCCLMATDLGWPRPSICRPSNRLWLPLQYCLPTAFDRPLDPFSFLPSS